MIRKGSFLQQIFYYTKNLLTFVRSRVVYENLEMILVLITNLTSSSDETDIYFLLNNSLTMALEEVMEWNDPNSDMYSISLDARMLRIYSNLVLSPAFSFGDSLIDGGKQYILDRFASLLIYKGCPDARQNATIFMSNLIRVQFEEHRKLFLIQNYNLVKTCLIVLQNEKIVRNISALIELIEFSFLKRIENDDFDDDDVDPRNVRMTFVDQFMQYDGPEIFEKILHDYQKNEAIYNRISNMTQRYYPLVINCQDQ